MSDDNSIERDRRFFIICFFNHSSFLLLFLYSIIIIVHSFQSASLVFHYCFYQYNLFRIIFLILQDVVIDTTFWQISSNHHQMAIVLVDMGYQLIIVLFHPCDNRYCSLIQGLNSLPLAGRNTYLTNSYIHYITKGHWFCYFLERLYSV